MFRLWAAKANKKGKIEDARAGVHGLRLSSSGVYGLHLSTNPNPTPIPQEAFIHRRGCWLGGFAAPWAPFQRFWPVPAITCPAPHKSYGLPSLSHFEWCAFEYRTVCAQRSSRKARDARAALWLLGQPAVRGSLLRGAAFEGCSPRVLWRHSFGYRVYVSK